MSSLDTSLGIGAVSKRDLWCAPALPEWDVQTGGSCRCSVEHLWCDCDTLMLTSHVSRRLWTPFNLPISLALHIFLRIASAFQGILRFHRNMMGFLLLFCFFKKYHWNFDRDCVKSVYSFG